MGSVLQESYATNPIPRINKEHKMQKNFFIKFILIDLQYKNNINKEQEQTKTIIRPGLKEL